jgi:hypothetical protein
MTRLIKGVYLCLARQKFEAKDLWVDRSENIWSIYAQGDVKLKDYFK